MKILVKLSLIIMFFWHNTLVPALSEENQIKSYFCPPEIDSLPISDWENPTFDDYVLVQNHLKKRLSTILSNPPSAKYFEGDFEGWITYRLGRLQLVDHKDNPPIFNVVYINNNPEKKDRCVICYGSYNSSGDRDYILGIQCMIRLLKAANFDGHFIYRVGGWPNLRKGRLKYADVPYAFKPFFFEEVRDLGYKKILWLDSASMPVKSLNPIFKVIEKRGCCFFSEGIMSQEKIERLGYVIRSLNIPYRKHYMDILTQVVGFDLNNKRAAKLLDLWIEAARKKVPFLEPSGDQASFAFLVHQLNLTKGALPHNYYQEGPAANFNIRPETIIFHQYEFLNPYAVIPENVFY